MGNSETSGGKLDGAPPILISCDNRSDVRKNLREPFVICLHNSSHIEGKSPDDAQADYLTVNLERGLACGEPRRLLPTRNRLACAASGAWPELDLPPSPPRTTLTLPKRLCKRDCRASSHGVPGSPYVECGGGVPMKSKRVTYMRSNDVPASARKPWLDVLVDGVRLPGLLAHEAKGGVVVNPLISNKEDSDRSFEILACLGASDFAVPVTFRVSRETHLQWFRFDIGVALHGHHRNGPLDSMRLLLRPVTVLTQWTHPFSPRTLLTEIRAMSSVPMSRLCEAEGWKFRDGPLDIVTGGTFGGELGTAVLQTQQGALADPINKIFMVAHEVLHAAERRLAERANTGSIVLEAHFPPGTRTACEQYLLYFVQFLADLGIEADAAIENSATAALFRVTPRSGPEALGRIRQALDTYLRMASATDLLSTDATGADIAVLELRAEILQLRSRLELAAASAQAFAASLHAKDTTILMLASTLRGFQLAEHVSLLSEFSRRGALTAKTHPADEEVIPGVLSVTEVRGKGIALNLPELIRRLRRRWK